MKQPVMWIDHWITVLPDSIEDEIRIWIEDLPRDRIGSLLNTIVRAGEAAIAASSPLLPSIDNISVDTVSDTTPDVSTVETVETVETDPNTCGETETPGGEEVASDSSGNGEVEEDTPPSPPSTNAAGRRDWTPKEDAVVRAAPSPAVAYKMYYDAFPHIKRSKSSIKSRWYRLVRWADEDGDRILPPPDLDHSGLRYGTRVVITGDGEFAGETGVVKRVNGDTNEVLVAIDGAPDMVWMPVYAVNIDGDGL
jgi:hypothetical protein